MDTGRSIPWFVVTAALCAIVAAPARALAGWQTFTTIEGLASNSVYWAHEDADHVLWFSTAEGISRFDGVFWQNGLVVPSQSRPATRVLLRDRRARMWIASPGYINQWDRGTWKSYPVAPEDSTTSDAAAFEDSLGRVWFQMQSSISVVDSGTWTRFTDVGGYPSQHPSWRVCSPDGSVWQGDYNVVSHFDGRWRTWSQFDLFGSNGADSPVVDAGGSLWLRAPAWPIGQGVVRFDVTGWHRITRADGLLDDEVMGLAADDSGFVWVGSRTGVTRWAYGQWQAFPIPALPPYQIGVRPLHRDRSGVLWAAIQLTGGLARLDRGTWSAVEPGFTPDYVAEDSRGWLLARQGAAWLMWNESRWIRPSGSGELLLEDAGGNLWFTSVSGGVVRFDRSDWAVFSTTDSVLGAARSLFHDREGSVWAAASAIAKFNGQRWTIRRSMEDLNYEYPLSAALDSTGRMWFGMRFSGVLRYDGAQWAREDSVLGSGVQSIFVDHRGGLWFVTSLGIEHYEDSWTRIASGSEFPGGWGIPTGACEDRDGAMWFSFLGRGAGRFDGATWQFFGPGLHPSDVDLLAVARDSSGAMWFVERTGGVARFRDGAWTRFGTDDGLPGIGARSLMVDRRGWVWVGTCCNGLGWFDGTEWRSRSMPGGLVNYPIASILERPGGEIWFGTEGNGIVVYMPDRTAPRAVWINRPPPISTSRRQLVRYGAAYGEGQVEFEVHVDGLLHTSWTRSDQFELNNLPDGPHEVVVLARDADGNVDGDGARTHFEVDATAPAPTILSPTFAMVVRDSLAVVARASDSRFQESVLRLRPHSLDPWGTSPESTLVRRAEALDEGVLCRFDTRGLEDGMYDLRLSVADSLGLVGTADVSFVVDNQAPWSAQTSPVRVRARDGGDVYTPDMAAHCYVPPNGLDSDAEVSITPALEAVSNEGLPPAATPLGNDHVIAVSGAMFRKAVLFDVAAVSGVAPGTPSLFRWDGTGWAHVGGTLGKDGRLRAQLRDAGRYALFAAQPVAGTGTLERLSFTPRVLDRSRAGGPQSISIGFVMGQAGSADLQVFNRSGRVIRTLLRQQALAAGANVVEWDGRGNDGASVPAGLYIVALQALGSSLTSTLAVVR